MAVEELRVSDPRLVFTAEMSPFDFLQHRGESDPRGRSAIMSVSLLDTNPGIDAVRAAFDRTSRVVVRLRQRVVIPSVPVAPAQWFVDPDFDLTYHVRRVRAPSPGQLRDVLDLASTAMSTPLDAKRPLWEAILVEDVDIDGASAALLLKISHAMSDGVGAVELWRHLYDFERDPDRGPLPILPVPEDKAPGDLVSAALRRALLRGGLDVGRSVAGAVGRAAEVLRSPVETVESVRKMAGSLRRVASTPQGTPSPLLRRRGLGRRFDVLDVPFADLRGAAAAADGTVNDAYVASVCGALRRYHEELGVPVDDLPMAIPVNIRGADDPPGGNRIAGITFAAPIGITDPLERIAAVRDIVRPAVAEPAIVAFDAVAPALRYVPAPILSAMGSKGPALDAQASNLRGYDDPTYFAGAQLVDTYWFGPLLGVAVMAVVYSQAGTCHIGVHADTAAVADGDTFARCLREGFDEVLDAGRRKPAARKARRA
ncbi:MAG: wax ester/triacylglycerol synthase family O-acyltransferase [Acidimicrobiales bacterium]